MTADATSEQSARAIIDTALSQLGLQSLSTTVWNWHLFGRPLEQIMLDLRTTPEYKARFPAMDALAVKGHAITEAQYIGLETSYTQILRAAGAPAGFYDTPDDFTALISGEVAPTEFQDRVKLAQDAVYNAPAETRAALHDQFGISDGDLWAYWQDPAKALPVLTQTAQAARLSGVGAQTGYGQLSAADALRLQALGVSPDQATQGLSQLVQQHQLFNPLLGEQGYAGLNTGQQLGMTFGGDSAAQQQLDAEKAKRAAEFQGDASFTQSQTGASGLGPAR